LEGVLSWQGKEEVSACDRTVAIWWALTNIVDGATRIRRLNKENIYSRAYIAFRTEELVAKFSREYDGHIFKDKAGLSFRRLCSMFELKMSRSVLMHKGNESQAVVEFAPYQKLPLEKKKVDSRNATIDQGTS
jgi:regulator of nonsense transcripts 3